VRCLRRLNGLVQLALGYMQGLFGLRAVTGHIVVVRCAGAVHLMDCLDDVVMDLVEIMPVMDRVGHEQWRRPRATDQR
jgi:hypothetical protein